ncbi:PGF-CTERM-anchored ABC transporter substrate-binding protein [Natronosalvus rutilus]|uniref:PGF-CTERM-anchored ABC transporter substrate-binding protein n=1 Tax=Natronosalvus rutilus TaxID=2953753 RepID=A0A9E7SU20_9EURY|nr:PGF-CTERM-anchored ABC transporter substrate-binding protein [Natronosalvus rutilus]UTF53095.1 PGF-CTERM-anchored ABC transporter substrate-binding protein [Natronosalvus rutilus]
MRRLLIVTIAILALTASAGPALAAGGAAPAASSGVQTPAQADSTCEYPIELEDATGEQLTLEEPPESIVALYPSDAQLVYSVGAEDRLEGMPMGPYTEGLETEGKTDITADDGVTPVVEEIIALEPDVVLAANVVTFEEDKLNQLRDAGIDVYVFDSSSSVDDVRSAVEITGQLTGACDSSDVTLEWMDERLSIIEGALADEPRPSALYAMDGEVYTTGTGTFQHEILTTAGVENVAANAGIEGWGIISDETIIDEDPEWILYGDDAYDEPPVSDAVGETTAMQEDQHFGVDANAMSQPAPNVVFAIEDIFATVHADAYGEVEADLEAADESYEESLADLQTSASDDENADEEDADSGNKSNANDSESEMEDEDQGENEGTVQDANESDDEDSIPGFGVPVALAAIAGLLGLRRL